MKINILSYAHVALSFLLPLAAGGQNLDPTVEVSRTYEGKLMEVHKPQLMMEVPDSLMRFDLDFDYSVTETPYRGSYEFKPYSVSVKPSPAVMKHDTFYLKAGAGYQLHPVLDMVWNPKFRTDAFRMNLYASHNSFFGNYLKMAEPRVDGASTVLDRASGKGTWKGHDMDTEAGVRGRADWEKGLFLFDFAYHGMHQNDSWIERMDRYYYSLDAKLGMASKKQSGFLYKFDAAYSFAEDTQTFMNHDNWYQKAMEFDFDSSWGYVLGNGNKVLLGVDVNTASMDAVMDYNGADVDLTPAYVIDSGRWHLNLGVRFSAALSTSRFADTYGVDGQYVYPDVRIEFMAIRNALKLYVDLGGDSRLNSYSDLLVHNRRAYSGYAWGRGEWELMDVSEEKLNAAAGVEGRIGSRFGFELKGGYVKYADMLMDGVYMLDAVSDRPALWLPALGYGSYDEAFVALDWLLDMESVCFDGRLEYVQTWANKSEYVKGLLMPASLTGGLALTYDWRDRIFAGIDCEFSTARKGEAQYADEMFGAPYEIKSVPAEIPGYADLGVNLKYVLNRKLAVWAHGGNLLGMTIQRSVLYAEKGPYFTAGITLNL